MLVFATNNRHKLDEVSHILGERIRLLSLKDIGCDTDIPETANTLEGNALLKAEYVYNNYRKNCFADDTGLEIEALNNEPGVFSARYAGETKSAEDNMRKVLQKLKGVKNRKAQFRTVISLITDGKQYRFEGVIKGRITEEKRGDSGFGYDPIFVPDGYDNTFAELGEDIKNKISHRALAIKKLAAFLNATSPMSEKEKAAAGMLYAANTDKAFTEAWQLTKERCADYNALHPSEKEKRDIAIKQLLGKTGERIIVVSPFYCDYGINIEVGEDFFANMNLVILDGGKVKIGTHAYIAPNVGIYTAGHPLDAARRNQGLEYALPVTIGDNVWIGAQVAILPGVTIGDNAVIGAGSVVNRNIPPGVLAAGNPCKVIRAITEEDGKTYR